MIIHYNPYDYVSEVKNGAYNLRRATPAERAENLRKYKKQRKEELEREIRDLEKLQ